MEKIKAPTIQEMLDIIKPIAKEERKVYWKAYYKANKDKINEQQKAYREANKDKIKERRQYKNGMHKER